MYNNINWPAVFQNLRKAKRWWGGILKVLTKTEAKVWSRGMMYKGVSHTVLLYGRDSWVVTGEILNVLEGFHHQADRRIAGTTEKSVAYGTWEYPPVLLALEVLILYPIQEYIQRQKDTIVAQVA